MQKNNLAIIPARSGSKGLANKNILHLNGKPLINYTIEAAQKSNVFKDIIVSTDSVSYKKIAEVSGAWVPFLRSPELSSDTATTNDVIIEILSKLKFLGKEYDSFALLQPTSPLRDDLHIKEAYELFIKKFANAVISLTPAEHSPLLYNTIDSDLCIDNFLLHNKTLRQQMETYYRINGAIYILKTEYFLAHMNYYHSKSYGYIMDKYSSVDIDDYMDFEFAEFLLTRKLK